MDYLILFVALPILAGLFLYLTGKFVSVNLSALIPALLFIFSLWIFLTIDNREIMTNLMSLPLPYGMSLRVDSLSSLMLVLNNFLFLCMVIFSFKKKYMNKLFIFIFLSLEGIINGIFLSTDLFNIYILIEVSTIAISILIMFKKDSQSTYDGMIYLLINMVAMAFFLFGTGYLYKISGALDIFSIKSAVDSNLDSRAFILPFSFIFTSVCLKSALMPLYSWLPKAHGAISSPSVVSAILSGIFIKTGIYLLMRVQWIFESAIDISSVLIFIGFITAVSGFVLAISQTNIKLILAYHTISQVGLIVTGIAGPYYYNLSGGLYHILAHGIFKSLFFLIAGLLIHHYNTRNIREIRGLWYASPLLSIYLIVGILSITGAPFFSGGYSKYFISKGYNSRFYTSLFTFINIGTMISFIKFFKVVFSKPDRSFHKLVLKSNEKAVLSAMCIACIFLGVGGTSVMSYISSSPLSYSLYSQLTKVPIYLVTYAIGILLYSYLIKNLKIISIIRRFDLSFNSMSIALALFFLMTLSYLTLTM